MKKILFLLVILLLGVGVGGGAAIATNRFIVPKSGTAAAAAPAAPAEGTLVFVPVEKVVAPLVLADGGLSGYVSFDAQLQVGATDQPDVTAKLPLLLHEINMRTYRSPLATGPDGMLPNIGEVKAVVQAAAVAAFGKAVVRRIAITRAEPI